MLVYVMVSLNILFCVYISVSLYIAYLIVQYELLNKDYPSSKE